MSQSQFENPFLSNRLDGMNSFRPEWDVSTLGQSVFETLSRAINEVRDHPTDTTGRRIHLLLGPAGHGKTHVFGRLWHEQQQRVRFVFVTAPNSPEGLLDHILWQVVESLFHAPPRTDSPIRGLLARLLIPSFVAYFEQLPDRLRDNFVGIRRSLESDPAVVLQLIAPVTQIAPFHHLAESVIAQLREVSAAVIRAMILGLSPMSDLARRWLRGEAEQLSPEQLRLLQLPEESPTTEAVLITVAKLHERLNIPLVLCLDQLDLLYSTRRESFGELAGHLMGLLQNVPNFLVVLGCVEANWREIANAAQPAFIDRLRVSSLLPMTPDQARAIITRRMQSWDGWDATQPAGWPFNLLGCDRYLAAAPLSPRALLDECAKKLDDWDAKGRPGEIDLIDVVPEDFVSVWERRLAETRQRPKSAKDYSENELWNCVEQGLHIARQGQYVPQGVRFEGFQTFTLKTSKGSDLHNSAQIHLGIGKERKVLIVTVSKLDAGVPFTHWVTALRTITEKDTVGSVVVRPSDKLAVGSGSQGSRQYHELIANQTMRTFALDEKENEYTLVHLACLQSMLAEARSEKLLLNGKPLSESVCRDLIVQHGVLSKLNLFAILFENWPKLVPQPVQAVARTPVAAAVGGDSSVTNLSTSNSVTTSVATLPSSIPPTVPPTPIVPAGLPQMPVTEGSLSGEAWAHDMLEKVEQKLRSRGQPVQRIGVVVGPTFVWLKFALRDDTDVAKIKKQAENLKVQLHIDPLISSQPGFIAIDVARPDRQTVELEPLLAKRPPSLAGQPSFPVGVDLASEPQWLNLAESAHCHLLIAGTTGSGKSQLLKSMVAALAAHLGPDRLQFILVDPKRVTFSLSGESPYLLQPTVYNADAVQPLLDECCAEMDHRYKLMQERRVENIRELTGKDACPYRVVVVDEFADLMSDKSTKKALETALKRLGGMGRAAGIHLVLGTQRPEASVVTPILRSNLPGRISLKVTSEKDSKIILELPDAAHLRDRGDLLWKRGGDLVRLQSPLLDRDEFERFLRTH